MKRFLNGWGLSSLLVLGSISISMPISAVAGPQPAAKETTTTPRQRPPEDAYTRAMRIGYAAAEQFDYNTALINFRRALQARPGDEFALAAIANMQNYIVRDRNARRQQAIDRLQARFDEASAAQDWVCAAGTLDELIAYTEPDSLNRERLVAHRGQLSGLLDARDNLENWSTICTPTGPIY
jgi:hypothetical protein